MPEFEIGSREHVLVVGQNQSGKSTLVRALTAGYRNVVVIDPKHEETLARSVTIYSPAEFARVYPQRSRRIVFRPDAGQDRGADVGSVLARVERYGSTAVVIHEAMFYATAAWILPEYRRLLVAGAGRGCPVWSLTQRPHGVHNVILSEARHVFVFDLTLETDRSKVAGIVGPAALIRPDRPFAFGYYGPRTAGVLVRCSPLEAARGPSDARKPGDGDGHGDGRDLHPEGALAHVPDPRPVRSHRRDLSSRRRRAG